jgi:GT2 family glycosyltransferase
MKTAAVILNHNLPDWTDRLYETLKPYEREDYDLCVFDNGSPGKGISQYTTYSSDTNLYFGGGFNAAMQMVLEDDNYDSLLFLNNDLTIHPYNFVKVLRDSMFKGGWIRDEKDEIKMLYGGQRDPYFDIVSPCFYNVEPTGQCHWKTMHCWGSGKIREVPYIDFQCPLISKRLLKEIKEINSSLMYGWGICFWLAIECKKRGWKLGVLDNMCVLHHNSLTVKNGVAGIDIPTYCRLAEEGQLKFFKDNDLINEFMEMRKKAEDYSFP